MELPSVFPIFPLSQVVLVPGALLPLHVFEPRYREMVQDALQGHRSIAMAACTSRGRFGDPAVDPIIGLGRILHRQLYPDGRSDIILEGLARMEIEEELVSDKPYRIVRASPMVEIEPLGELVEDLGERASSLLERIQDFDEKERRLFRRLPLTQLLDSLLLRVHASVEAKHEIFAMPRLVDRLAALERHMTEAESPPSFCSFRSGDPRLN
ncbi:MAG: LON peptidase substrate-binding domain-containing protein [Planctomycetes bacterium]|nr:LON peptidase substrate-binding domain-containing protein [Planctomycetota bacterium]MCB9919855.1 LON peptidase substrate-binding domain-containing protein [Planctomycetota bacterium]